MPCGDRNRPQRGLEQVLEEFAGECHKFYRERAASTLSIGSLSDNQIAIRLPITGIWYC